MQEHAFYEVPHALYFHVGHKQSDLIQWVRLIDRQI